MRYEKAKQNEDNGERKYVPVFSLYSNGMHGH